MRCTCGRLSRRRTPVVAIGCLAILTLLLGLDGLPVVLVYLAVNVAVIRAFRTEFRHEFRLWRHLVIPGTAAVLFLCPLWGILRPPANTLMAVLPFISLGWLCIGVVTAGLLRTRRSAIFETLGRVFVPGERYQQKSARHWPPIYHQIGFYCQIGSIWYTVIPTAPFPCAALRN